MNKLIMTINVYSKVFMEYMFNYLIDDIQRIHDAIFEKISELILTTICLFIFFILSPLTVTSIILFRLTNTSKIAKDLNKNWKLFNEFKKQQKQSEVENGN